MPPASKSERLSGLQDAEQKSSFDGDGSKSDIVQLSECAVDCGERRVRLQRALDVERRRLAGRPDDDARSERQRVEGLLNLIHNNDSPMNAASVTSSPKALPPAR